VTGEVFKPRLF